MNQKTKKNYSSEKHGKITYLESRNPFTNRYKILHVGCRSRHN